ncbi:MAG: type IV pilus assembly protein PilM [Gemmatimonas sp.]|nr:type IV pilus assembly protein PilM [Gemmatimonas sp.]
MMGIFPRARHTVGLDIGSRLVKVAAVDHSGDEPRLVRIAALPLASDAIVEGEIMDLPLVTKTIGDVIGMLGMRPQFVVTAIGGRDVIVKRIQMERMPEMEVREVIRWEAQRYVPFDMESVLLDFQVLDPEAEGLQMSVLLVAAKRDLVEQRLKLLKDAGLGPAVVDVDAFALFNAFEHNYASASAGSGILVNVGHETTTVVVHDQGAPTTTRDIPFGAKQVRADLRRLHGLSSEVAEEVVRGERSGGAEMNELLYERGVELAQAIERAIALPPRDGSGGLQRVSLSGGGGRMPHILKAIGDRIRVRVEMSNPFQRLQTVPGAVADLPGDDSAALWMLPVGLALRAPV